MVRSRPAAGREIRGHRDRQQIPGCLAGREKMPFRGREIQEKQKPAHQILAGAARDRYPPA